MDFQKFIEEQKIKPHEPAKARALELLLKDMGEGKWQLLDETSQTMHLVFRFHTGVANMSDEIRHFLVKETKKVYQTHGHEFEISRRDSNGIFQVTVDIRFNISTDPAESKPSTWTLVEIKHAIWEQRAEFVGIFKDSGKKWARAKIINDRSICISERLGKMEKWAKQYDLNMRNVLCVDGDSYEFSIGPFGDI